MDFIMNIIGYPLGWIMWVAYKIVPVYSIALIIFTIIVRLFMVPMAVKQQKNTAHMALFKPKVDAINKKYAKNPQKAQQEINKLYEKEGYNPFSGCSSLFLQLPIIYGLIDVVYRPMTHLLRFDVELITKIQGIMEKAGATFNSGRGASSMDVQLKILGQLGNYENEIVKGVGAEVYEKMSSLDLNFLGMNLGEVPTWSLNLLFLIPVFSLLTALLSSFITMKMGNNDESAQGKGCMYGMLFGMPFMSAYFSFLVPAGVGLYWIISNVVGTVQSVVLRKIITPEKYAIELEKKKASGKTAKKSKFMQKLIEAQEAQQGAASQSEVNDANDKKEAKKEADKKLTMTEQQILAEARRRYAEKYGDDIEE